MATTDINYCKHGAMAIRQHSCRTQSCAFDWVTARVPPYLQHDDLEAQVAICPKEPGVKRWETLVQYTGDVLFSNQ